MTLRQRVAVLVGILGVLAAAVVLLVPVSYTPVARFGGFTFGSGHCGPAITAWHGREPTCRDLGRDRVTIGAVVAGVSVVAAAAAVWLLRPGPGQP